MAVCSINDAKFCAEIGVTAIGIDDDKIVIITDKADKNNPSMLTKNSTDDIIMTVTDETPALAVSNMQFYSYSSGGSNVQNNFRFSTKTKYVDVGWSGTVSLYGRGCDKINWTSNNYSVASVNYDTGEIKAKSVGTAIITATKANTGETATLYVSVSGLLIYRTRNREIHGFAEPKDNNDVTPIVNEDFKYGDMSASEMMNNGSMVAHSDLYASYPNNQHSMNARKK